jgi:CRISPR/Cas system endoribonuclease Cas6 (RAMP superfamily)
LYEHTPEAAEVTVRMAQTVRLTGYYGQRRVWVGSSAYSLDQARDLIASIQAAIKIGEHAG